jgi:hypothetical protein
VEELVVVAKPGMLLAWYRKLITNKVGRPRMDEEAERLVVPMAKENPSWGNDRIRFHGGPEHWKVGRAGGTSLR